MPIKGLSEVRRLPRLGKVRLGVKAKNQKGTEYPKAVDYFVCPPEVQEVYGARPKELDIVFPLEADVGDWQWYKAYSASRGLICKGDGETAMALIDIATGQFASRDSKETEMREVVCDPKLCPVHQKAQCHRIMSLQFLIRGVKALGVYQLDTGSVNSILNVQSTLSLIKGLAGRYSLVPMKLQVIPHEAQVEGKKKTVHVLQLVVEKTFDDLLALPELTARKVLLPAADTEAPDDLYPEGLIEGDPDEMPPQIADRPAPARRRGKSKAPQEAVHEPDIVANAETGEVIEADNAAEGFSEPAEGPPPCSTEMGSVLPETKARVATLLKDEVVGLIARKLVKSKGWTIAGTQELSEYQGQVIIAVCEGRDENDVVGITA